MLLRTREGATTFLTQHSPFRCMWRLGQELILLYIYIQKGFAFFKYYLKILIRMAIMPHTRAKTELRHERLNLLQSVINTAKHFGKCNHLSSWCGRKSKRDKQGLFRLLYKFKSQCPNISRISNQFRKIDFWFIPPKQPFGMVISENDIKKSPSALHLDNFRKVRKFTKKYNFYSWN